MILHDPPSLASRILGGEDATRLADAALATLRSELGREPTAEEIRSVMVALMGLHGELAARAGAADGASRAYAEANIAQLNSLLDECPMGHAIERIGLESRRDEFLAELGANNICASRRAAWLQLTPLERGVLRERDREEGRAVACDEMRVACSCGAKEGEFCR